MSENASSNLSITDRLTILNDFQGSDARTVEAFVSDWIEDLSHLPDADLVRLISKLRHLGVSGEFIRYWRQAIRTSIKEKSVTQPASQPGSHPYFEKDNQLYMLVQRGSTLHEVPVASFVARIIAEIAVEYGGRSFLLEGQTSMGRKFSFTLASDVFSEDHRLEAMILQHAGTTAVVRAGMSRHLHPAIQLLSGEPQTQIRQFQRTGWDDRLFLIPGTEPQHVRIELPEKLPYRIVPESSLNRGLQALMSLVEAQSTDKVLVILSFVFQSCLADLMGWRSERYGLFIAGRTGTYKTSIAQLAMSLFGPGFLDENVLIRWGIGATLNSIISLSTHANDLPFMVDNFKPNTGQGTRDLINLVHAIMEGSEKDRLRRDTTLRSARPIYAWLLLTGEDTVTHDAATLARLLIVRFEERDKVHTNALTHAQQHAHHLNAIGASWLNWLPTEDAAKVCAQAVEQLPALREGWIRYLQTQHANTVNPARVATNLATNQLTWWVLQHHPQIGAFARQYAETHRQGLYLVANEMARLTAEALEANRFLETLAEIIASGRYILLNAFVEPVATNRERFIGWRDEDDSIYLLPETARRAVESVSGSDGLNHLSSATLYSQLAGLGLIQSHDHDRHTKNIRVSPTRVVRTLHLKPDALRLSE